MQETSEVLESEWNHAQVLQLFDDLRLGATVQHVQLRSSSAVGRQDQAVTMTEARQQFADGCAEAIQIRYLFADEWWCDTLIVGPQRTKIIRTSFLQSRDNSEQDER